MAAKDQTCRCFNAAFINSSQYLPVKYLLELWHMTRQHSSVKWLAAWVLALLFLKSGRNWIIVTKLCAGQGCYTLLRLKSQSEMTP